MTSEPNIDPVAAHSASSAPASQSTPARSAPEGPGRLIHAARERASLSIDELAQQTKLARPTLEALENDDFAQLNEAVYVRGYYRKIAKALALPEADLLAAYRARVVPPAPPAPTKLLLSTGDSGPRSARRRGGWGWIVAILIVVALLFVGLRLLGGLGLVGGKSAAPGTAPTGLAPAPQTAPSTPAPSAPIAPPAAAPSSSSTEPSAGAGTVPSAAAAEVAAVQVASATGAAPLTLDFKSASWVRVEDADGKLLVSGVLPAGAHQEVAGRAPMSVFLGNAPGVIARYEGRTVDLAPYLKDNATARFSVP